MFNDAAQFTGPLFLNALIGWVANPERKVPIGVKHCQWSLIHQRVLTLSGRTGVLLAVAMFVFQMLGALGEAQFFQLVMRSGMNVKAVSVATTRSQGHHADTCLGACTFCVPQSESPVEFGETETIHGTNQHNDRVCRVCYSRIAAGITSRVQERYGRCEHVH